MSTAAARWSSSTVNRVAVHDFWWVTLLSFGPVLIVRRMAIPALPGANAAAWHPRRARGRVASFFYFFVNVRDHQDVYVGWRVGHFLFMAAAVVIGALFERRCTVARRQCAAGCTGRAVAIVFLAGLPTTIIDIYNTQDITNHNEAPAGPLDAAAAAG